MPTLNPTHNPVRFLKTRPVASAAIAIGGILTLDALTQLSTGALTVTTVARLIWDGLLIGLVLGLGGIGLSLTYRILNFANVAHGEFLTIGAFSGWGATYAVAGLSLAPLSDLLLLGFKSEVSPGLIRANALSTPIAVLTGLLIAATTTSLIAVLIDQLLYRGMRDADGVALLTASVGIALALRYLIAFVYGTQTIGLTAGTIPSIGIPIIGISINLHEVLLGAIALGLMATLHTLLNQTTLGIAMRAVADDQDLARVTGISTERIITWTWITGATLAGCAGYLISLERGTLSFNTGWLLLLLIFAGVLLGGIGSVYGAMLGGLVIGLVRSVSLIWVPSSFGTAVAFAIMVLILLVKPTGIFEGVSPT